MALVTRLWLDCAATASNVAEAKKLTFCVELAQGWANFSHEGQDLEKLLKPLAGR